MQHFHKSSTIDDYSKGFLIETVDQFYSEIETFQEESIIDGSKYHIAEYGEQSLLHLYSLSVKTIKPHILQLFEFGTIEQKRGDLVLQDSVEKKLILIEAKKHYSNPKSNLKWKDQVESYYQNIENQALKYYNHIHQLVSIASNYEHKLITLSFDTNPNPEKSLQEQGWDSYVPVLPEEFYFYKEFPFGDSKKGLGIYGIVKGLY